MRSTADDSRQLSRAVDAGIAYQHRNINLDALRGLAILLVLGHHFPYFSVWANVGWAGVDLFFVLSGFLVSGLLFAEWKRRGHLDIRRFYIRRAFKIWPPLYIYIALTALPVLFYNPSEAGRILRSIAVTATFTANYLPGYCMGTVAHLWSLAVEEHFYLFLPVLLWGLHRIARHQDPFRAIVFLFPLVAVLNLVMRGVAAAHCVGDECGVYSFPTHLRLDGLMFGVWLAYLRYFRPSLFRRIAVSRTVMMFSLAAIVAICALPSGAAVPHAFGITLACLGLGCLVPLTVDRSWPPLMQCLVRSLAAIGMYSYSIYLWHSLTVSFIPHNGILYFGFYLAVSIVVGALATRLVETHALRLRDRLFPSRTLSGHAQSGNLQGSSAGTRSTARARDEEVLDAVR